MIAKFESTDMYPRIEQALVELGLSFYFQARMPLYGVADYVIHDCGKPLVVIECKQGDALIREAIVQVWSYCVQYRPMPKPVLMIMERKIRRGSVELCEQYDVEVIPAPLNGNWNRQLSRFKSIKEM